MRRSGFTLVEMIVTTAVIGVLIGILAPSLAGARGSAQAAVCASNIRQLQLATQFYAADHSGLYPPGARDFAHNLHRWHGSRASTSEPFSSENAPLTSYVESDAVGNALRACPTFAPTAQLLREDGAGFELGSGGYGYNNAFVGVVRHQDSGLWRIASDRTGSRADRFRTPAKTIAFSDAAFLADRLIEYSFVEPRVWPEYPGYAPDPSTHFRHGGAASVAWLDGHVSAERAGDTAAGWYSAGHAGQAGLGWPGPMADNTLYDYD